MTAAILRGSGCALAPQDDGTEYGSSRLKALSRLAHPGGPKSDVSDFGKFRLPHSGNRDIGLMLAATGFAVPDVAWLYFALAQFPIYLLPHLLKPLARRLQQKKD